LMLIAATGEASNRLLMVKKREAFEQVTAQAQSLLVKQREDYEKQRETLAQQHQEHMEKQREALAKQHQEHMEEMRKQNELLQEEVMRTRELYSQTYLQFEATPPSVNVEESRALLVQATLAKNLKNKAERHLADYELEKSRRLQKKKDREEAEQRIKRLRDELAFMEESFEVVTKRPFTKGELDSPELHAEKKVKMEEVPDNCQAVKIGSSYRPLEGITKSVVKRDKKIVEVQSRGSKPEMKSEEILELNSDGDVSGKEEALEEEAPQSGATTYVSRHKFDKSDIQGLYIRP
jgi:hypothetical protein